MAMIKVIEKLNFYVPKNAYNDIFGSFKNFLLWSEVSNYLDQKYQADYQKNFIKKKTVLKIFSKYTGKHLCWSLFLIYKIQWKGPVLESLFDFFFVEPLGVTDAESFWPIISFHWNYINATWEGSFKDSQQVRVWSLIYISNQ